MNKVVNKSALFVKNFPPVFTPAQKVEFLKTFGASDVRLVGSNCCRADFDSEDEASIALGRLHQMDIMGFQLVVTYARDAVCTDPGVPRPHMQSKVLEQSSLEDLDRVNLFVQNLVAINPNLDFTQPPNHLLRYDYPPATREIVRVIAEYCLAVPKLYTQVLHVMNRMNLSPPFLGIPPDFNKRNIAVQTDPTVGKIEKQVQVPEFTYMLTADATKPPAAAAAANLASGESELESDEDTSLITLKRLAAKRKCNTTDADVNRRVRSLINIEKHKSLIMKTPEIQESPTRQAQNVAVVFDQEDVKKTVKATKPLTLKIPQKIGRNPSLPPSINLSSSSGSSSSSTSGSSSSSVTNSTISESRHFLNDKELSENRVTADQMKDLPIFADYVPGTPSDQLYVKNIAKDVTQEDLLYVFGRYKKRDGDVKIDCKFQGKYRGQAWIKFATEAGVKVGERQVDRALREIHGYMLKNKPLHVSYARSVHAEPSPIRSGNP